MIAMRKIIFLDIDGVIATPESIDESGFWTLTERCIKNLQLILEAIPEAEICISSSWREGSVSKTKETLRSHGMPEAVLDRISGETIKAYHYVTKGAAMSIPRGVEIKQWIDHNVCSGGNGVYELGNNLPYEKKFLNIHYSYVILDDDADMLLSQRFNFVGTDSNVGLTVDDAERAIKILNGNRVREKI